MYAQKKINLKIVEIKVDSTASGRTFYKVFFEDLFSPNRKSHCYFVWPNKQGQPIQAFEMLKEKQFKVGDIVNIEFHLNDNYRNLDVISKSLSDNETGYHKRMGSDS